MVAETAVAETAVAETAVVGTASARETAKRALTMAQSAALGPIVPLVSPIAYASHLLAVSCKALTRCCLCFTVTSEGAGASSSDDAAASASSSSSPSSSDDAAASASSSSSPSSSDDAAASASSSSSPSSSDDAASSPFPDFLDTGACLGGVQGQPAPVFGTFFATLSPAATHAATSLNPLPFVVSTTQSTTSSSSSSLLTSLRGRFPLAALAALAALVVLVAGLAVAGMSSKGSVSWQLATSVCPILPPLEHNRKVCQIAIFGSHGVRIGFALGSHWVRIGFALGASNRCQLRP